jgi:Domain of unknown function (DUF4326)
VAGGEAELFGKALSRALSESVLLTTLVGDYGFEPVTRRVVLRYRLHIEGFDVARLERDLSGKDLACWCPLDQPCHADVLLELANQ